MLPDSLPSWHCPSILFHVDSFIGYLIRGRSVERIAALCAKGIVITTSMCIWRGSVEFRHLRRLLLAGPETNRDRCETKSIARELYIYHIPSHISPTCRLSTHLASRLICGFRAYITPSWGKASRSRRWVQLIATCGVDGSGGRWVSEGEGSLGENAG